MPKAKKQIQRKWSSIVYEIHKQQTQILKQFEMKGLLKNRIKIKWQSNLSIPKMLVWTTLYLNGEEFNRALEILQESSSAISKFIMEDAIGVLHLTSSFFGFNS